MRALFVGDRAAGLRAGSQGVLGMTSLPGHSRINAPRCSAGKPENADLSIEAEIAWSIVCMNYGDEPFDGWERKNHTLRGERLILKGPLTLFQLAERERHS